MIKKLSIFLLAMVMASQSFAQVNWVKDEKLAISLAAAKDQLILIDFWATWCGPCRTMDKKLWNTAEMASLSEKVIPLKIDIDIHKEIAMRYNITSIPRVLLITANGDVVWDKTGFSGPNDYQEVLNELPKQLGGLSQQLLAKEKFEDQDYFQAAISYQKLAKETKGEVSSGFLSLSDSYFKKAEKETDSEELANMSDMYQLMNDALRGKHEKALKKMAKIEIPNGHKAAQELQSYILAYCYKCDDNQKAFIAEKEKIKNEEYLNGLN